MNIDVVITLPNNLCFPLWSQWMTLNQGQFNKVYVAIHQKNIDGYDFTEETKRLLKDVKNVVFVEEINPMDGKDWRDIAVNKCLNLSQSKYVLFMEGDFFITDTRNFFYEYFSKENDIVGWCQGGRFHPSFLCVKRSVIDQTSRDFSPIEDDHFGKFSREIIAICKDFRDINMVPHSNWFHMNGLTQNFTLVELGQAPNHDLPNFMEYCRRSIVFGGSQKYSDLVDKALSYEPKPTITPFLEEYI